MLLQKLNDLGIWRQRVSVFGHVFRTSTLDRLASLFLHKFGILGREEIGILRRFVRNGMTVVDIGANQGLYTLLLAELARPGKIHAFEPHPMLYQQVVENLRENRIENVECHQTALSNSTGFLTLQLGHLNLGDNYIVADGAKVSVTAQVPAATLDDLFEGTKIDFLKIDVQGWEAAVLAGGRSVLEENPKIILLFEFWPYGLRRAGVDPQAFLSYLIELGFSIYGLSKSRLVLLQKKVLPNQSTELAYCNLVALRN
ncbi:MAG: FkbM family methyltransferase [Verrucomicrobia bacterium]|nr:FkbM family methyltransferase [Verrucomicrobiota bacterium]